MLGFGKGKMEIKIDKFNFSSGETIKGIVVMNLKKPLKAKELTVTFLGEERISEMDYDNNRTTRTRRIYESKQPLDGEKEYPQGEDLTYQFEIKIPENILEQQKAPEGALGTFMKVGQFFSRGRSQVSWYLLARLDIPWGIDVKKRVQINLG